MLLLLFTNGGVGAITGTLGVTDAKDIVAFSGDFPVFASFALTDAGDIVSMAAIVSSGWAPATKQLETWTPAVQQVETWTAH